jgi:hypothetical protein
MNAFFLNFCAIILSVVFIDWFYCVIVLIIIMLSVVVLSLKYAGYHASLSCYDCNLQQKIGYVIVQLKMQFCKKNPL